MRIAILEDDHDQVELLATWLEECGHHCKACHTGTEFIRAYSQDSYDFVVLDWMLPKTSGLEVLKHLRNHLDSTVPVVFITQRDAEEDIVTALQNGADDYMTKPVSQMETIARVNAIARRLGVGDDNTADQHEYPPYSIDTRLRHVLRNGKQLEFTQKEYELILFLFKNLGRVISRGHMLEMIWGTSSRTNTRTVDTHISRIRTKLGLDEESDWKLTSVYRYGYRLENVS